ncbi:MAG: sortase [Ardenticatenales bacterium]|nr:sortase [Ardenticatenales bacterium]
MATRPPSAHAPRGIVARALAGVVRSVGTLLLLCGAVLVLVGLGVHLSRQRQLAADEGERVAPRFEDTVALGAPGTPGTSGTSGTPGALGAKHVADRGPSVSLAPRVVVFGAPVDRAASSATPLRRFGKGGAIASPTPPSTLPPDRIVIRSIDVDRPVVPIGWTTELVDNATLRSVWRTADDAAGWHETSAPLGGVGNTVVSGHNNIAGAVFRSLHELAVGDVVTLHAGVAEIRYAVERTFIVRETGATDEERRANNRWIEPTDDERLTLVTCYPPWGNTHRLIVIARPVVYILPTAVSDIAKTRDATGGVR